jgi:hypothetical protein
MSDEREKQGPDELLRGHELDDLELPPMFRGHDVEVPYTREQLAPTIKRLRDALELDLGSAAGTSQQRLAAAWTRIAELRLPRKAVPNRVLDEVEYLVGIWDSYGQGGIARYAFALSDEQIEREHRRIARMLELALAASSDDFPLTLVPTE